MCSFGDFNVIQIILWGVGILISFSIHLDLGVQYLNEIMPIFHIAAQCYLSGAVVIMPLKRPFTPVKGVSRPWRKVRAFLGLGIGVCGKWIGALWFLPLTIRHRSNVR